MKRFLLTISMLVSLASVSMAFPSGQKMHDQTVKNIIADVQDDIKRTASYGHFETSIIEDFNDDTLNKVVMYFVHKGYTVTFDVLPPDYDSIRLYIKWEKTNE